MQPIDDALLPYQKTEEFNKKVMNLIKKGISSMEAVLEVCEIMNIDPETAAVMIHKPIKEMIEREAINLNLLKKNRARLPGV